MCRGTAARLAARGGSPFRSYGAGSRVSRRTAPGRRRNRGWSCSSRRQRPAPGGSRSARRRFPCPADRPPPRHPRRGPPEAFVSVIALNDNADSGRPGHSDPPVDWSILAACTESPGRGGGRDDGLDAMPTITNTAHPPLPNLSCSRRDCTRTGSRPALQADFADHRYLWHSSSWSLTRPEQERYVH